MYTNIKNAACTHTRRYKSKDAKIPNVGMRANLSYTKGGVIKTIDSHIAINPGSQTVPTSVCVYWTHALATLCVAVTSSHKLS